MATLSSHGTLDHLMDFLCTRALFGPSLPQEPNLFSWQVLYRGFSCALYSYTTLQVFVYLDINRTFFFLIYLEGR
jgi:hypothetical protein